MDNGRGIDQCTSALFVCVLCCGTMAVRPFNASGLGDGVWPEADRADGSPGQGLIPDREQKASGGTCSAHSSTHPLTLFPGVNPGLHRNTCYRM